MSCRWNSHDQKTYIWLRTYRSLIFVPHDSKSGMLLFISSHIEKRNVEPAPVARSTVYRPSHCPVRRNEQRGTAPREVCIQQYSLTKGHTFGCPVSMICVITTPSWGISRCFVFDEQFEVAKFMQVKTKASRKRLFQYVLPCPLASGRTRQPFICSNSFAPWWALGVYVMRSYSV